MTDTERALRVLDAGKEVRIKESELADIPLKPPMRPSNEAHLAIWEQACFEWRTEKGKREAALAESARIYLSALFDAVADQVEAYINDHVAEYHRMRYGEPVGDD